MLKGIIENKEDKVNKNKDRQTEMIKSDREEKLMKTISIFLDLMFYVYGWFAVCMGVHHMHGPAALGQKKTSGSLRLELQTDVGCHVGSENLIDNFRTSNKCF